MDNQNNNNSSNQSGFNGLLHESNFPGGIIKPNMLAVDTTMKAGDTYYVNSSGIFQRLAPGNAGQVLTMVNGIPTWTTPGLQSGCSVYLSGNQSVGAGSFVKITFDTKAYDGLSEFDTTNHKFIATTAGRYLVTFDASVSGVTATQAALAAIYKNGSLVNSFTAQSSNASGGFNTQITSILNLAALDFIEFYVLQSDSGARTFSGGATNTVAMIQRLL